MKKLAFVALTVFCLVSVGVYTSADVFAREISAKKLIKKAKRGNKERQYELAQKSASGYKDIKQDEEQAFYWYQQAANQGHVKAQGMLGLFYKNGIGTEVDIVKAKEWYKKASANGHIMSYLNHGMLLLQEKDYVGSDALLQNVIYSDKRDSLRLKGDAFYGKSEIEYTSGNKLDAYSWYILAQLAGAVRQIAPNDKLYMEKFIQFRKSLSPDQYKQALTKALEYHYLYFVKHMYYIENHKELAVYKNIVLFKKPLDTVGYISYHVARYSRVYGGVKFFKKKMDKKSRINYAIWLLRQAETYLAYGSLDLNYYSAQNNLEKADKVFDEFYDENSLKFMNEIVKEKLALVRDLAAMQVNIRKEYIVLNVKKD